MTHSISDSNWEEIGLEQWPGRFFVRAEVEAYRNRGWLYNTTIYLSHYDTSDENTSLQVSLGFPRYVVDEIDIDAVSLIADTFSEQQADELVGYLNSLDGFQASKIRAHKPKRGICGRSAVLMEDGDWEWNIYQEEGYPLDFKVVGYFYLGDSNRIGPSPEGILMGEIKHRLMWCPPAQRKKVTQMMLDLINENIEE